MGDLFIVQFFKKWKQVGAILPSSIFLVDDMLSEINFEKAKVLVEFGAGSGNFTTEILKRMGDDTKFFVFEIDNVFFKKLHKIKDKRMILINDSAVNIEKYLGKEKADYIVSGIPLSNLNIDIKKELISNARKNLDSKGKFLQFQYIPESFILLKKYFPKIDIKFTLFNTPPAFFYICQKEV